MRLLKYKIFAAAALLIILGCARGPFQREKTPPYTVLQESEDTIVVKLPNRLIAVARRMPSSPVASAQVRVETGSIFEQEYAGAGISHFLEHLLSGGSTTTRSEKETNKILGQIGAQKNAATGLDGVFYYINTTNEHIFTAVDLLSDWMLNSTIPGEEFDREREVIQQEIAMGDSEPGRILWKMTQQARYRAHPGRHPTIGYKDEFLQITREQVVDFYRRMYAPNNMVFTVAGDIDPARVVERIAGNFRHARAAQLPEITFPREPEPESPRSLSAGADISRPRLRLAWPGTKLAAENDYALDLLAEILGRGESSRLNRTLRDELGLVTGINAYNLSFYWGEGFFGIDAQPRPGKDSSRQAVDGILEQIRKLREEKVAENEINRAVRNIMARTYAANQKVQETASRLASDTMATGNVDYLLSYLEAIQKLTPDDLLEAARRYLKPERLITVRLLPETREHPAQPLRRVPGEDAESYPQTVREIDNRRLADKLRSAAEYEYKSPVIETGDYELFTLENGLRLITQRSTVVPEVAVHIYFKGGLLGEEPGGEGAASAVTAMLDRGTENYSASEFAEAVENLGASITAASGYNTDYIRARSLSEDWEKVMGLMAEMLLRPSFPHRQWELVRPRLLARIDRVTDGWYGELTKNFRLEYFKNHPWSQTLPGRRQTVKNITVEGLRKYHKDKFDFSGAVMAVTGDIDPDRVVKKVRELFAGTAGRGNAKTFPLPEQPGSGLRQVPTAKPVVAVKIGLGPAIERSHQDYTAMRVLSSLISDFPAGWLQQALRGEGPGLAYAAWGRLVTGLVPGYFEITFNTSAEDAPEALNRTAEVIKRSRAGKIDPEEIKRAKSKVMFEEFFTRQSNSQRALNAALDELYGVGGLNCGLFAGQVKQITPAHIREIARRRFKRALIILMAPQTISKDTIDESVISGDFTK